MSRELDREVAEKIMGWTGIESDGVSLYGKPHDPIQHPPQFEGTGDGRFHVPHYSKKIFNAFQVLQRLYVAGFEFFQLDLDGQTWKAAFWEGADGPFYEAEAEQAPEAICRAALAAYDDASTPERGSE